MARGFVSGALLGGGLSLGAAAIAAMLAPPPERPELSASVPGTIAPALPDDVSETPAPLAEDTVIGASDTVPQISPPEPDSAARIADNTPKAGPGAEALALDDLTSPVEGPTQAGVELATEEPILPNPQALAPMAPPPADQVAIDTESAARPMPREESAAQAPTEETQDAATISVPNEENTPPAVQDEEPEIQTAAADEVATAVPEASEPEVGTPVQPSFPTVPAPEPDAPNEAETEPQDSTQSAMLAPTSRPQIGTPATSLTERDTGVIVNRLGRGTEETASPASAAVLDSTDEVAEPVGNLPPVQRFASAFQNDGDKPLMSILLIDDGTGPTTGAAGIAALRSFPYPLSFAVDSSLSDAAARVATYRDAGFEVMAMVDLPEAAEATDAETTLGATLPQLGEVIGVLEGPQGGLQGSREVSDQVTAILAQTGHGLVTQNRGLNTMSNLARKEGVPSEPIFRDFDSKGQTPRVMRRFLDQAAFKAGQEGSVIMLGRLRPDTISALLLWGLQDRASSVALAPVSAVITRNAPEQ